MGKLFVSCGLLLVSIFLTVVWTRDGLMLATGEEGMLFVNIKHTLKSYRNDWRDISLGTNQGSLSSPGKPVFWTVGLLDQMGLSVVAIQRLLFIFIIFSSLISAYWFSSLLLADGKGILTPLIISVFYIINPFTAVNVWNRFLYSLMFSLPLLSASLAILIQGYKSKNIYWAFIYSLPSLIYSFAFTSPAIAILLVLTSIAIGVCYSILMKVGFKWGIRYLTLCLSLWILANLWWLLPVVNTSAGSSAFTTTAYNINSFVSVSRSYTLPFVVRLLSSDFLFENQTWGSVYLNWPYQLISWVVPISIAGVVLFLRKNPITRVFFYLMIIGLFFSKGSSPPMGDLMLWLLNYLRPLQLLRNPFEKMGLMMTIAYSGLLTLGIDKVLNWFSRAHRPHLGKAIILSVFFLYCGLYLWPVWTGKVFGKYPSGIEVDLPNYYGLARSWLDKNVDNYRVLALPSVYGDGGIYKFGLTEYHGLDPLNQLLGVSVISQTTAMNHSDEVIRGYLKWRQSASLWKIAGLFSAKYIMTNPDLDWNKLGSMSEAEVDQLLKSYKSIGNNFRLGIPVTCLENDSYPICSLDLNSRQWQSADYLSITATSESLQPFEVNIVDSTGHVIRFDGYTDSDYVFTRHESRFILPLRNPTETNLEFSLSAVAKIKFFSKNDIKVKLIALEKGSPEAQSYLLDPVEIGRLKFYEISPEVRTGRFFAANDIRLADSPSSIFLLLNDSTAIPGKSVFVSSKDAPSLSRVKTGTRLPEIEFERTSASEYRLKISNAVLPYVLVFHESFHPKWKVFPREYSSMHFLTDGYANGYLIDRPGDYDLRISYEN